MICRVVDAHGDTLKEEIFISIGGGFINTLAEFKKKKSGDYDVNVSVSISDGTGDGSVFYGSSTLYC